MFSLPFVLPVNRIDVIIINNKINRKSMTQGVSEAAKKSQIEAAETAIKKEHEAWSNSTKNG